MPREQTDSSSELLHETLVLQIKKHENSSISPTSFIHYSCVLFVATVSTIDIGILKYIYLWSQHVVTRDRHCQASFKQQLGRWMKVELHRIRTARIASRNFTRVDARVHGMQRSFVSVTEGCISVDKRLAANERLFSSQTYSDESWTVHTRADLFSDSRMPVVGKPQLTDVRLHTVLPSSNELWQSERS